MQTNQNASFNDLVDEFLGGHIPQELAASISLPELPPDTREFILRMFALMKRAGYSAAEFNPALIRWLAVSIPSTLPSAWGGRIPPLTLPGRHRKLDAYVASRNWPPGNDPHIFVDVGCGFPPVTTSDTAQKFSDWHIYGIDRSFSDYVLYDSEGHYACFDDKGGFQYFQAFMTASGRDLYADPDGTRKRFTSLFKNLFPGLQNPDDTASETVTAEGNKLVRNHIRDFETDNLTFIKSDIAELDLQPVKVVRCMNLLIYFMPEVRKKMVKQIGGLLDDEGILITGTNGLGIQTRYTVYQKDINGLSPTEFAFSLDNVGHIVFMPFFTIHDDDPEAMLLAELAGTLRSDVRFWSDFRERMDGLLRQHEICKRGPDGFLHFLREEMPPDEWFQKNALIWQQIAEDDYPERAAGVLEEAGYKAWVNPVGDIAVLPDKDYLS